MDHLQAGSHRNEIPPDRIMIYGLAEGYPGTRQHRVTPASTQYATSSSSSSSSSGVDNGRCDDGR
jgi:hypothetical protein